MDEQLLAELTKRRNKFRQYISAHWHQLIPDLCSLLLKLKEEGCLQKLSRLMVEVAQLDCSRLHHPRII